MYPEVFWYIQRWFKCSKIFWVILQYSVTVFGCILGILMYFEVFWSILRYSEVFRGILKYSEAFWSIVKYCEVFWGPKKYSKTLYSDISLKCLVFSMMMTLFSWIFESNLRCSMVSEIFENVFAKFGQSGSSAFL